MRDVRYCMGGGARSWTGRTGKRRVGNRGEGPLDPDSAVDECRWRCFVNHLTCFAVTMPWQKG